MSTSNGARRLLLNNKKQLFLGAYLPETDQERIVIVGAGFAGLKLARKLGNSNYQVVLVDRNNYHQFQPLFYQVAMAGLEPSSIVFPLRKIFQKKPNVFIRLADGERVDTAQKVLQTSIGPINYDHLILAMGATTNFFGNEQLEELAMPMKTMEEALSIRNAILEDYEQSLLTPDYDDRQGLIDIVVVGGGPTGVEVCGALAEMKKYVLPKDFTELNCAEIDVHLIQSSPMLLKGMSEKASAAAKKFLEDLGVHVKLNTRVTGFDGSHVQMNDGTSIRTNKVIWAAGVKANCIAGIPESSVGRGGRIIVDHHNRIKDIPDVYALGDLAYMETEAYPKGHPQVAQVAVQQAELLAVNIIGQQKGRSWKPFRYKDKGSMATIGRHRAVVDLKRTKLAGAFAWFIWLFVHLLKLVGTRNKVVVFLNWVSNYLTYDQSLRLILRTEERRNKQ